MSEGAPATAAAPRAGSRPAPARVRAAIPLVFLAGGAVLLAIAGRQWPAVLAHHGGKAFEWPFDCPSVGFFFRSYRRPDARQTAEARGARLVAASGPWWSARPSGAPAYPFPDDMAFAEGPMMDGAGKIVGKPAIFLDSDLLPARCEPFAQLVILATAGAACLAIALALGRERARDA
ncbi:MAG TPA: hypothetical protein VHF22_13045, partial [Planctomycetota bacterium]|nr:hypothetical protein [Planctomycetota bacterium]